MAQSDWRAKVESLRNDVGRLRNEPARSERNTVLHDAWRIILRPAHRASLIYGRLDELLDARHWVLADDDRAEFLRPKEWTWSKNRVLSPVYVALSGALTQYLRLRIRWVSRRVLAGPRSIPNAPVGTTKALEKLRENQRKASATRRRELAKAYKAILDEATKGLVEMQTALAGHMKSLGKLTTDMQRAEESRLKVAFRTARSELPDSREEGVRRDLEAMQRLRLNLRSFDGVPASRFRTLLDHWVGAQRRVESALTF